MKKIVIVTGPMIMGGIERALIAMLKTIPKNQYDVTVLVTGTNGKLFHEIPDHVKVEPLFGTEKSSFEKVWKAIRKGRLIRAFKITFYTLLGRMTHSIRKQERYCALREPKRKMQYDLGIAYYGPTSLPVVFVMDWIKAKTKAVWIHVDVSKMEKRVRSFQPIYEKFDKIFCVSEDAMQKFVGIFPDFKWKTEVFYSLINKNHLIQLANRDQGFTDKFDGFRILTVARLSAEKGQEMIPGILMRLRAEGYNVRWYCVGDGDTRSMLEDLIKRNGLEEHFILLGTKQNPYNYINQCDIYVQPSKHEGYCLSLAEARAFHKPIVTTDFVGAREQIDHGKNGFIVDYDEKAIYMAIKTLIINTPLRQALATNLKSESLDTTNEINKLYKLLA